MRVARRLLWSTLLLLSQVACATSNWSQPIGEFKRNVDGSVAVVATYYGSLNEFERHLYLENAMADPDVRIATKDETGKPTPLGGQVFSARSIKARMDALALVSLYARRLADLAGTRSADELCHQLQSPRREPVEPGGHLQGPRERRRRCS